VQLLGLLPSYDIWQFSPVSLILFLLYACIDTKYSDFMSYFILHLL
jgi:hypothetical protein